MAGDETAREKEATGVPVWVRRSSGSRVRRPIMKILFSIAAPPYSSLQTIMERITPSVIRKIRSSSAGNAGAAEKVSRT